jgi:hypothetical protein
MSNGDVENVESLNTVLKNYFNELSDNNNNDVVSYVKFTMEGNTDEANEIKLKLETNKQKNLKKQTEEELKQKVTQEKNEKIKKNVIEQLETEKNELEKKKMKKDNNNKKCKK